MAYVDAPKSYGPHLFPKDPKGMGPSEFHYYLMVKLPKMFEAEYKSPFLDSFGVMLWSPKGVEEIVFSVYVCHVYHVSCVALCFGVQSVYCIYCIACIGVLCVVCSCFDFVVSECLQQKLVWSDACSKMVTYFWSKDPILNKATAKQFPGAFFERMTTELKPRVGLKPGKLLNNIYNYVQLVSDDAFAA